MNSNNALEIGNDYPDGSELDAGASVEDFIRELEEKERDLHITAELRIEVSESEFDDSNLPDFIIEDLKPLAPKQKEPEQALPISSQMRYRNQIDELESTINKFKVERSELLERSRRQAEDFENFKNRTERERNERLSMQMENLAIKMLPVLDNLDRAMESAAAMSPEQSVEIEQFLDGIALVHRQVNDVLEMMGVQPILCMGQEFDPIFHEAVAIEPSAALPPNTVSAEMIRGYRMGSRVVRHAMVKVTAPAPKADDEILPGAN
jgi:molecular chaperone GrpE